MKRHPRPPTKGERKENEWKRERDGGAASKLAQGRRRRRNPTERYKFDFIALLELMLEASTNRHHRVGGDGGRLKRTAQLKEAASERETAARRSVGRPTGGFPTVAGKQGGWRRR